MNSPVKCQKAMTFKDESSQKQYEKDENFNSSELNNGIINTSMNLMREDQLGRPSKFYEGLSNIGKHYLMWNPKKQIKRHYTITNCFDPLVFK